jgi:histidine ammonia-lyase
MGTIAARDCLRVTELVEQVAAALLIAVRQACCQRYPDGLPERLGDGLRFAFDRIAELVPFIVEDRRLDHDLRRLLAVIRYDGAALLCRGAAEASASS